LTLQRELEGHPQLSLFGRFYRRHGLLLLLLLLLQRERERLLQLPLLLIHRLFHWSQGAACEHSAASDVSCLERTTLSSLDTSSLLFSLYMGAGDLFAKMVFISNKK
jgi:hypothetical protein